MSRIKIKNFGPIKEGLIENEGWIDVKKVTVFIGNQGSGKSTVAKLISTMSWLEKAMVKGILHQNELNTYNRFLKHLAYQKISNYIKEDTEIEFNGKAFSFLYMNHSFTAHKVVENGYLLPKIMYVPAERNFLSVVDRPDKLKNLPNTLYTFNDEYDAAKNLYSDGIKIPINDVWFEYDRLNKLAHISAEDGSYHLRLSESSSGFQSTVPLFLVTKYLSDSLTIEMDPSIKENSLEEQKKLDKEIKLILADTSITPEVRQAYLRQISNKRKPACFLNIVEEPEQNLFPASQQKMLNSLLEFNNMNEGNKLIMTTHSPYLINYLTHAVKAFNVLEKINATNNQSELKEKLNQIVPLNVVLNPNDWVIYELDEHTGSIKNLGNYKGLPDDNNYLNELIGETNELFANLLEIEDKCQISL
jgi:predicted ATPase